MKSCGLACAVLLTLMLGIVGCTYDITKSPETYTDYRAGSTYELLKPAFIFKLDPNDKREIPSLTHLGASGTSTNLEVFKREMASDYQVVGLLMPEERLSVVRITREPIPGLGRFTIVYAKIESGEFAGRIVGLDLISKAGGPDAKALINPDYLVEVK